MRAAFLVACLIASLSSSFAWASQYDLSIPEAEERIWDLGGYFEGRYYGHLTREGSALSRLKQRQDDQDVINDWRLQAQLRGSLGRGKAKLNFLTNHLYQETIQDDGFENQVYEGYLSLKPSNNLTIDVGKKVRLWGKGYAWTPVGFISRPKDPDEPELSLEGYVGLEVDFVKSFARRDLTNLAFTAVLLPVWDWENIPLGQPGDLDLAAKAYFLLFDTDIDFLAFQGPSQPTRLGLDFSRNLKENLEIHGELAVDFDAERRILGSSGGLATQRENQVSYLVGFRYLTAAETTFIAEYYHNGRGYSPSEAEAFYGLIDRAWREWLDDGNTFLLDRADNVARPFLGQRNYGTDYFYLRVIQKDPLDILYSSAWVTTVFNLADLSFSISPGASYMLAEDLEISFKGVLPFGGGDTEFGEKSDAIRLEVYFRYYF